MAVFGAFLTPARPQREGPGHGARARGAPHPRLARQRLRHVVQLRGLRGGPRDRTARHGSGPRPREGTSGRRSSCPATRPTRARSISRRSARSRTRSARCCGSTRATSSGWSRVGPTLRPVPVRRRRDVHHAQGAARPARRHDPVHAGAREGHRQGRVPDDAGRAARALHRRQGGGAEGGEHAGVPRLRAADRARRPCPRGGPRRRGLAHRLGRHGLAPDPGRRPSPRHRRQDGRGRCGRGGDRAQQEPDPVRPEPTLEPLGDPGGHTRPLDPGHGRAGDARDREHHRATS